MGIHQAVVNEFEVSLSVGFGEVPEILELFRYLLLERDDITAIFYARSHCLVSQSVDFVDLLSVSVCGSS